ncbi:LOW QUALITY PROTEIN: hypothetical protein IFM46972_04780 [Aspergillus udagawae]|uniref:Uncharacterized protein n=1 Tax=Aspergillus udagawae TaxID=91492 RepID=A0A8H3NQ90_9EURO|nr:LOW QUALITY PROTEIN: hypothetical protein IFM46972_04780 [Aspergillus udagawae]
MSIQPYDTLLTFHDESAAASVQDYEGAGTGVWDLLLNHYFNQRDGFVHRTQDKVEGGYVDMSSYYSTQRSWGGVEGRMTKQPGRGQGPAADMPPTEVADDPSEHQSVVSNRTPRKAIAAPPSSGVAAEAPSASDTGRGNPSSVEAISKRSTRRTSSVVVSPSAIEGSS